MFRFSISDGQKRFCELVKLARDGVSVAITDRGKPVARIAPLTPEQLQEMENQNEE